MNPVQIIEFQKKWAGDLGALFASPLGVAFLGELKKMEPSPACDNLEHQASYRLGAIAGYQQCLANMGTLSTLKADRPTPEINYGVKRHADKADPMDETGS